MEQTQKKSNMTTSVEPTKKDYLLGPERSCRENLGNELLRVLINFHYPEYQQAKRKKHVSRLHALRKIIHLIVVQIENCGGRFLKRVALGETSAWTEMTHKEARALVLKAFGNKRREMRNASLSHHRHVDLLSPSQHEDNTTSAATTDAIDQGLNFTRIFSALHISTSDDGPRRIMETYTDDQHGVEDFLARFNKNPDTFLTEFGFTKPLHKKRLRGLSIWVETVYSPQEGVHFNRQTWLDFFAQWVRDGCPSLNV